MSRLSAPPPIASGAVRGGNPCKDAMSSCDSAPFKSISGPCVVPLSAKRKPQPIDTIMVNAPTHTD